VANVETTKGVAEIIRFIVDYGMLEKRVSIDPILNEMLPAESPSASSIQSTRSLYA